MSDITIAAQARHLTAIEIEHFAQHGYLKNLPLLNEQGVQRLQHDFMQLVESVPETVDIYRINNWHKANRWFYELGGIPEILDYVEDLLGPDFYQWGGSFFIKFPNDESTVPWHQDAKYWPLEPRETVTVWLSVFDTDTENGCMRVVPGSHRWGDLDHKELEGVNWYTESGEEMRKSKYVLWQQVDPESFEPSDAVDMDLKAGEISLHDDDLIHGSTGNPSSRMRAGITLRYSPCEVKCDLSIWPTFESYHARGVDRFNHNPVGKIPAGNGYPTQFNQNSSDFD